MTTCLIRSGTETEVEVGPSVGTSVSANVELPVPPVPVSVEGDRLLVDPAGLTANHPYPFIFLGHTWIVNKDEAGEVTFSYVPKE